MPSQNIPESVLAYIDVNRADVKKYTTQRHSFREQVSDGKGFAASAFFPADVLPPLSEQTLVTRCMVPSYPSDALPERMTSKAQSKSDLTAPRPGLGYGFHAKAFTSSELEKLPCYLSSTGTRLQVDTTACATGSALYVPFMSFERVFSGNEYGIDLASNQCAVDGAWCVRALQMLYAAAAGEDVKAHFENPVSFSCCVDNELAIMNFHWIDHAQTYCMCPLVKFDLTLDKDFDQFLLWTEAISHWAVLHLLPEVKRAVSLLSSNTSPRLVTEKAAVEPEPSPPREAETALASLKTNYDYAEWQLHSNLYSPGLSSTASWGSPMIDEAILDKLTYPKVPQSRGICSDSNIARVRFPVSPIIPVMPIKSSLKSKTEVGAALTAKRNSPPLPAYEKNTELLMKKRLGHAMVEIEDLQTQMLHLKQEFTGSVSSLQTELAGMRKAMTSMVRKEKSGSSKKSSLRISAPTSRLQAESQQDVPNGLKPLITTPTEFRPAPLHQRQASRAPSGLSNVLTPLDTNVPAVVSVRSPKSADSNRSPTSADSDLPSPEAPLLSATLSGAPSPSIAPSDAISCISCLSCRKAAAQTRLPTPKPPSPMLESIVLYKKNKGFTAIFMQLIVVLCVVDYLVLLSARLHSPAVMDLFNKAVGSYYQ